MQWKDYFSGISKFTCSAWFFFQNLFVLTVLKEALL